MCNTVNLFVAFPMYRLSILLLVLVLVFGPPSGKPRASVRNVVPPLVTVAHTGTPASRHRTMHYRSLRFQLRPPSSIL